MYTYTKKTCSTRLVLFICTFAWSGIWVTHCPPLEKSQSFRHKSLLSSLMEDWTTGLEKRGKSQARHNCPLFTHICTSWVFTHTRSPARADILAGKRLRARASE